MDVKPLKYSADDVTAKILKSFKDKNIVETDERTEAEKKVFENKKNEQYLELQKKFSNRIYWTMVCWSIGLAIVLLLQMLSNKLGLTLLSNGVLITLLSTTTANIIGLMYLVTKYFFTDKK